MVMFPDVDKILTVSNQIDHEDGPPEEVMSMLPEPVEIVDEPIA